MESEGPQSWWIPFDEREAGSTEYLEVLHEGVPDHLIDALRRWIDDAVGVTAQLTGMGYTDVAEQLTAMVAIPIDRTAPSGRTPRDQMLRVADAELRLISESRRMNETTNQAIVRLQDRLTRARSAYRVGYHHDGETLGIFRRVNAVATERLTTLDPQALATGHLRTAWSHLYKLEPDPRQALDEAIAALESAMKATVTPNDGGTTLGKMIAALRHAPHKWRTPLGDIDLLVARLRSMWSIQPRHGVDDPNDVKVVTPEAAEASVHEAITIVHWFQAGLVRRNED